MPPVAVAVPAPSEVPAQDALLSIDALAVRKVGSDNVTITESLQLLASVTTIL